MCRRFVVLENVCFYRNSANSDVYLFLFGVLTFTPFWITIPPHVLYALRTLTCCPFLVFALPLPPMDSVLQPPLCGTRSHLAFATLPLPIPCVAFLKLTASSRLLTPPSGSPKCLRFGLWLTQCTLHIYLLTYLLTYLEWVWKTGDMM